MFKMHIKIHVSVQPRFAGNSNTIQDGKFLLLFSLCVVNRITINLAVICCFIFLNNSEYDQEIPQSQTADKPMAPWGWATQQSQDARKTKLSKATSSLPYQDDCKTRMDIK